MAMSMVRSKFGIVLIGAVVLVGCGKSEQASVQSPNPQETATTAQSTPVSEPSPTDIVSQFLDEIRRGGEHTNAGELLTELAQSELDRIGHTIQPIGSPDARFKVTRAQTIPDDENAALVHTIWSEPNDEGGTTNVQVVWAVQKEAAGWRISGMVMELDAESEPIVLDFENGDATAKTLGITNSGNSSASPTRTAAAEGPTTVQ